MNSLDILDSLVEGINQRHCTVRNILFCLQYLMRNNAYNIQALVELNYMIEYYHTTKTNR